MQELSTHHSSRPSCLLLLPGRHDAGSATTKQHHCLVTLVSFNHLSTLQKKPQNKARALESTRHQTPAQVVAGAGARHYWRWGRLGPPTLILLLHLERRWGNSTSSASLLVRVSVLLRSLYIIITVAIDQGLTMVRRSNLQLQQDSTEAPASTINW